MKRFDYEDEDYEDNLFPDTDDDDDYDEKGEDEVVIDSQDYIELLQRQETLTLMQLDLVQIDLNQRLLFKVIKEAQKSWFWNFRSKQKQLDIIADKYFFYKNLVSLVDEEEDYKEEG